MEHLRHDVPTHIETPDTMVGIPMQKWFYLMFGLVGCIILFLSVHLAFNMDLETSIIICAGAMLPVIVLFLLPLGDDRIEQRMYFRMRFFLLQKICIWRVDAWRWQALLVEKTGIEPQTPKYISNSKTRSFEATEEI